MKKGMAVLGCMLLSVAAFATQNWKAVLHYDKQNTKTALSDHLKKYAQSDSHGEPNAPSAASTKQQAAFAKMLAKELKHIGASEVQVSKTGIITATLPATNAQTTHVLALVAHYDTPAQVRAQTPQLHAKYVQGNILLNKEKNISLTEENSPQLLRAHGHDFLTSDGTAAFGASSKAGLAILMTAADYLLGHPSLQHGPIKIVLLPQRTSNGGTAALDVKSLGAQTAYILDGFELGEIATGNFGGRDFTAVFEGRRDISLGKAISSSFSDNILMASDFHTLLPRHRRPENTSGMQGYILVDDITTQANRTVVNGHLRAFTEEELDELAQQVTQAFNTVKAMNPKRTDAQLSFQNSFHNVKDQIPASFVTQTEQALLEEDITPTRISVREQTDAAILTQGGLPAVGFFTGVFHKAEPLEYADIDIMEASLRALLSAIL